MVSPAAPSRALAAFAMEPELQHRLFDLASLTRLRAALELDPDLVVDDFRRAETGLLSEVEVLITGWGSPIIDHAALARMPRLRAVFHAAGTVKEHLTPAVWERGVTVTTAAAANSLPVAEYAVAMILLAGKGVLPIASMYRSDPSLNVARRFPGVGNYGRTVGIIGASTVGRLVIAMLASSDVQVLLYDPVITDDDPVLASARRVALDELFRRSLVVSIHAPLLPETRGLVGAAELAHLAPGSTLINTARAQIVDQVALQREVVSGRIFAVLDVTDPEPLPAGHVLLGLPGVFVTPHLAGALGNELLRLGECVVHEAESFVAGLAPRYPVLETDLTAMA